MVWSKERALEYVELNDLSGAYESMTIDLSDHPETAGHPSIMLGMMLMMTGHLNTRHKMRKFINDFN
jgi:hypothetical protein